MVRDNRRFGKEGNVEGHDYREVYDHRLELWWRVGGERRDGEPLQLDWSAALAHAWAEAERDQQGYNWRLPTVEELSSLVEIDRKGATSYPDWLPGDDRGGRYWSSSPVAGVPEYAWVVSFGVGSVGSVSYGVRDVSYRLRLVRGGSRSVG